MRWLVAVGVAILVTQQCVAPPVIQNKETEDKKEESDNWYDGNLIEYRRYLEEVVEALESDPEFRAKLKNLPDKDITNTKIAQELEFVNHNVRTKLDEIKRVELERLRHLATKELEVKNGIDTEHLKIPEHVDNTNPNTFEVADLKRLISKVTADLKEGDRQRRENFKKYEMAKKFEQEEKKKKMDEEHRKKYEEELKNMEKKHKEHKPLHHPGSKQQLEEVWEQQDHMEPEDFDPRAFFFIHDLDGNRVWDQDEVKALFLKELDKMYNEGVPEDDLRERAEELERMREHVFKEADLDEDGLISFKEFLDQTKKPEFNKDEGWNTVDEIPSYTEEDYEAFLQKRHHEIQKMVATGILPPDHGSNEPGHPQQFPPQYGNIPVNHDVPLHHQQQFQGQVPPQQQFQGQVPPQQQFQGQVPPQQQFHGQVPPQQQFHGQVPPQQQFRGQIPPQHIQEQQYQQGQQQIPQHQAHSIQGQPPHPKYQQGQVPQQQQYGQVPVQQQHTQQAAVPVQQQHTQQAAVPVQQNTQNQANLQGQVQVQQQNVPALNNQAQQQAGLNQVPVLQHTAGNSVPAPVPKVDSV